MSPFFLSALSLVFLLVIAAGVSYWAKRVKIPATVALVAAGMLIAVSTRLSPVAFLDDFELTPQMLFYVFLPILLFESAYNVRYKELLRNIRSISLLAVVSLVISAVFIAFGMRYGLLLFGIDVPIEITLLFGALISSTDTAAVLAVFKELGVPRRLNLIFEGESLFNDGTAIALFLVVLGVVESHATSGISAEHFNLLETGFSHYESFFGAAYPFAKGFVSFLSMICSGILLGAFIGTAFSKVIQKIRNDKYLEITLSLALAHATFLIAEAVNHYLFPVSGIVATVAAAMVLGNYGRYKISPNVEEVMEKYWSFFAFVTNGLVFVLVGMMLVNANPDWRPLVIPIALAVPMVILARAASVYPVFALLNFSKTEEPVPRSWQHVLSWGALRGGLAVMLVLLVPTTLEIPGWSVPGVSVRDFLLSLTLGCVVFSVFVKTLTIAPLIRHFKIDALHEIEEFEYAEGRILMASAALTKIRRVRKDGYVDKEEERMLSVKYEKILEAARADAVTLMERKGGEFGNLVRRVAALHALGIEKYWLRHLYKYNEIPEPVFKKIMRRVAAQIRRVEKGESQIDRVRRKGPRPDFLERLTQYLVDRLEPKIHPVKEKYLALRTIHIITEKALA